MKKRQKALRITALVVGAVLLLGCTTGVVCDRGYDKAADRWTVSYKTDVEDGTEQKITTVKVDLGEMISCGIGEEWPACKEDAIDYPSQLVNEPTVAKDWDERNRNSRTICVGSVSEKDVKITNTWFIGGKPKTEKPAVQGIFERCVISRSNTVAYIKAEHHAKPSTLACYVFQWDRGKKRALDFSIATDLGDCVSQARVP